MILVRNVIHKFSSLLLLIWHCGEIVMTLYFLPTQAHIKEDASFVFDDQEFDDEVDIEEEENEQDDSDIAG